MSRMKGSPRSHIIAGSLLATLIGGLTACSTTPSTKAPTSTAIIQPTAASIITPSSTENGKDSTVTPSAQVSTRTAANHSNELEKTAPAPEKSTQSKTQATPKPTKPKISNTVAKISEKATKSTSPTPIKPAPQKTTEKNQTDRTLSVTATQKQQPKENVKGPSVALLTPTPTVLEPPKAETSSTTQQTPEVTVKLELLPMTIASNWILDQEAALPAKNCVLRSNTILMEDGQGSTRVYLELTPKQFNIRTKSNIDLGYEGDGLQIDTTPFELESLLNETSLAFTRQYNDLLRALKQGETLKITLGFWPSWPVSQTYSSTVPITGFDVAYSAWNKCNKML